MSDVFRAFKNPDGDVGLINAVWAGVDIPDGWESLNVGKNVEITTGDSFDSDRFTEDGEVPLIKNKTVKDQSPEVFIDSDFDDKYLVQTGDLLVTMDGEFVPRIWGLGSSALNQRVCRITPGNKLNKRYLRYSLEYPLRYIQYATAGTTVKHLSSGDLNGIELPSPPLSEQRRVASVLYSVDQHIDTLDRRHTRLRELKHALMQDLLKGERRLTCGPLVNEVISSSPDNPHSGNIDRHELQNGPYTQKIPSDWGIATLDELCDFQTGLNYESEGYLGKQNEDAVPFITLKSINKGGGFRASGTKYYDGSRVDDKYLIGPGSVLISNTDVTQSADVLGMPAQIPISENVDYIYSMDLTLLKNIDETVNPVFLNYLLRSNHIRKRVKGMGGGTTVLHLNTDILPTLEVPIPPLDEQERIASQLYILDEMIARTTDLRNEYEELKRGLMQDLLSGDVRTPEDLAVLPEIQDTAQEGEIA